MSETSNLKLPLLAAAQAQKHVTMNEALSRIDAVLQMSIASRSLSEPPASVAGEVYLVSASSSEEWVGQEGQLAFAVGDGWDFITPLPGWKIWIVDEATWIVFDGVEWLDNALAASPSGAALTANVIEFDEVLTGAGATFSTTGLIPSGTSVMAVTGRVIDGFDGGLTSWDLGVSGADDRYGSGLGKVQDAWVRGLTGQPQSYYADTPLTFTAIGGDFGNGRIRIAIHLMSFGLPRTA